MIIKTALSGSVLAAILALPGVASADVLLDTGTPTGTSSILSTVDWYAAEFTLTSAEDVTALSVYLEPGTSSSGSFDYDLYNSTGFTGSASGRSTVAGGSGIVATFASGWSTTAVNVDLGPGTYWIAVQVSSTSQTHGFDLPSENNPTDASAPAGAFAYLSSTTNGKYTTTGAPSFGVQVAGTPVPVPPTAWLLGGGLLGLVGAFGRRARS